MRLPFALVAYLLLTVSAYAQIEIPAVTPLGKDLTAKVPVGEGDRVAWLADAGSSVVKIGNGRAHVWSTPGSHKLTAILIPPGDADPIVLTADYAIDKASPPGPDVKTLADLAGPLAPKFVEILTDGSEGLDQFATVKQFQKFLDVAFELAKIQAAQPAAVEIKRRVDAAASGSLTDASRKSLAAALAGMASELGGIVPPPTPPPTPVVEGKRLVVVISEADDASAWFANLKVNTANDSDSARWIRKQGHVVRFLEEEQLGQDGKPLPLVEKLKALGVGVPAVFVLDPTTQEVLYKLKLEPNSTIDNLVEYIKRGGG